MHTEAERYRLRIGLFSIGLEAYWPQFGGLREQLLGYNECIAERLQTAGASVVNLGLVDSPAKALEAGHRFRESDVDLIFLHVATYALSSTVLPVVRRAKVPVVVLNLAPGPAIEYSAFNRGRDRGTMTGEWLRWCQGCPVPELANVFSRSRLPFFQVTGMIDDDPVAWGEIEEWLSAARTAHILEHNRLGLMGRYYGGMLDIYSDLTRQCATFGGHIEMLEVDELTALRRAVTDGEQEARAEEFQNLFDVQHDCPGDELRRAARTSVALDRLVEIHGLGSLAYFYQGIGNADNQDTISSIILGTSLLTARGVPVAGEYEVKNAQAMKILDTFRAGGSFTEFYATDFEDDVVLMGHDGPGHIAIADGKTKVRPLGVYHGKVGAGLSVEMSIRKGPVTLLSVVETINGGVKLLTAHGESVDGPILEIGNTNSRYRFPIGARQFVESWSREAPAHHCAVGVGHLGAKIEKLGSLLGLEVKRVC